jgi:glutathione S-transferase
VTASLTLYHIPDWASSIIRLALEEIGQPYRIHLMDRDAGDLAAPWFRALNPQGLLPTMDTADGPMFETVAILLWLNDRFGGLFPPAGDPEAAAFLSWLSYVSNTLHPTVMDMVHPERLAGDAAAASMGPAALERMDTQCGLIEALITEQRPDWLSSERTGGLGHYLGMLIRWAICLPKDPGLRFSLRPFPALRAVLAAHEASPAGRKVATADALGPTPFTAPQG